MTDEIHPEVMLAIVRSRCTIRATERKLKKSRYRRRPLSDGEIEAMLEQKAFFLGRQLKTDRNPFQDWDDPNAERLAKSFQIGRG